MEVQLKYVADGVKQKFVPTSEADRGLGDTIARFTKATGIKSFVSKISEVTGIPCGCEERRQSLNQLVPYEKRFFGIH